MRCPVCSSGDIQIRARPTPYTFCACTQCGLLFVDPMPEPSDVGSDHYDAVYYGADQPRADEAAWDRAAMHAATMRIRRIQRASGGEPGRFLDVGTGTGHLLAAAKLAGWTVQGVEVSARAASYASHAHGVPVTVGRLEDAAFGDDSFDAISLTHVLEHVPDPLALLREVGRVLAPGGALNVAVPNAGALVYAGHNVVHRARGRLGRDKYSCGLYPPDHVLAFDPGSLRRTLARGGFDVMELTISGKGDPDHFPVVSWRGSGRSALATAALEWLGRRTGRGSIIDCIARNGS